MTQGVLHGEDSRCAKHLSKMLPYALLPAAAAAEALDLGGQRVGGALSLDGCSSKPARARLARLSVAGSVSALC
jgi:hypothetical protein